MHGDGPALVCPAWWVSHLEDDWQDEGFRTLFGGLAQSFTVVRYDRVGSGLSDRGRDRATVDDEAAQLAELIDHLALPDLSMFAVSCGGPPALTYAARHLERIRRIVFFGSFMRGADVGNAEVKGALQGLVRAHWGLGSRTILNLFAPSLAGGDAERVSRMHRRAAEPEMAAQLLDLTFDADAAALAIGVDVPCLVVHRKGDRTIPVSAGRELAACLPDAQWLTIEGDAHVPWLGDATAVVDHVRGFLGAAKAEERDAAATGPSFRKRGDVWHLGFEGHAAVVKHARGLVDLALMLRHPGKEIHVAQLWSGAETAALGGGDDPVVDDEALASYRARFEALGEALSEAKARGDVDAAARAEEERETLGRELRTAVGLGGRKRGFAEPSERARKAVSARIRSSLKKIEAVHPALHDHLAASISTGMFCSYRPDTPLDWDLGSDA